MNKAVADSTVLIFLGKLEKIDLLKLKYDKLIIPEEIYREVVEEGKKRGEQDAIRVENLIEEGWIEVKKVEVLDKVEKFGLEKGEKEVLSLAEENKIEEVLADEEAVREAAKILDFKPKGTLYFLLKSVKEKNIDFDSYLQTLEELVGHGFYLSEEVYMEAVRKGKELSSERSD